MSLGKRLAECGGTVEVNAIPLAMLIGAATASHNGPDIETIVEMLDPETAEDDGA